MPDYSAFTVVANGNKRLREILTPADASIARLLARSFNLPIVMHSFQALWDTGATQSSISHRAACALNLQPISMCKVSGVGGVHDTPVYKIDLHLMNNVIVNSVEVTEFVDNGHFDILVGMDVITLGDLSITNANGKTVVSFRFPSDAFHIDYVKAKNKDKKGKLIKDQLRKKQFLPEDVMNGNQ